MSPGSGIPEMKTILRGIRIPGYLNIKTFISKSVSPGYPRTYSHVTIIIYVSCDYIYVSCDYIIYVSCADWPDGCCRCWSTHWQRGEYMSFTSLVLFFFVLSCMPSCIFKKILFWGIFCIIAWFQHCTVLSTHRARLFTLLASSLI